jgi:hypothetical protein
MTRTGKIARLPASSRDQLNRRPLDNEPGPSLLDWLTLLDALTLARDLQDQHALGHEALAPDAHWRFLRRFQPI